MGFAVFFAAFALYTATLAPTVTFWDSGELALGASSLGIPHHPGYPIFCMFGKAFSLLPMGNVAYRTNLMSAALAAAAVYALYRLYAVLLGSFGDRARHVAAALALAFAAYPAYWAQAVVTEVYSLNALLVASLVYALVLHYREGRTAYLYLAGLLLGLASGNHHSVVFMLPAVMAYLAADRETRKDPRRLLLFLFFIAFGAGVNLYIPLRAHTARALNIGAASDLGGLLWLTRWMEYAGAVSRQLHALPDILTAGRTALLLAIAGLVGALLYTARDRRLFLFLIAAVLGYYLGVGFLAAGDVSAGELGLEAKFYIPAVMLLPAALAAWLPERLLASPALTGRAAAAAAAMCLVLAGFLAVINYRDMDNSRNYYAWDFCANTLKSVDEGGALFAWGDSEVFPAWYLMDVEHYRRDVFLIDTPLLTDRWYVRQIRPRLERRYDVEYGVPARLADHRENVRELNGLLVGRAGIYYTFTAAGNLGIPGEALHHQGLVAALKTGRGMLDPVPAWDRLTMRGVTRAEVPRTQVAEDIFSIYGYQAFMWGEEALIKGRREEAVEAYKKAVRMGYRDPVLRLRLEALGIGTLSAQ